MKTADQLLKQESGFNVQTKGLANEVEGFKQEDSQEVIVKTDKSHFYTSELAAFVKESKARFSVGPAVVSKV